MITFREVDEFLNQFKTKAQVFGILFRDDRQKNLEALRALEITPMQREMIVKCLSVQDFVDGPLVDELNKFSEMWVFGKVVKGQEVYIKISMGFENAKTICISFHLAEYPMQYPFKTILP